MGKRTQRARSKGRASKPTQGSKRAVAQLARRGKSPGGRAKNATRVARNKLAAARFPDPASQNSQRWVIAIGASAGGLEAFKAFFANLPPDTGLAFVIAQHLSPNHKSGMVELLRKMTPMEVVQAVEGMPIERDRVHMIPPGQLLRIDDGHLRLTEVPAGTHASSVDELFKSLAASAGSRSVAIEMSGMGSDGTKGMAAIREAGGLVVVQAPESAKSSSMPASVIASGVADIIAPAEQIPALLLERLARAGALSDLDNGAGGGEGADETALRFIQKELRTRSGHDFSHYKRGTILRRVKRRMEMRRAKSLEAYAHGLQNDPEEVTTLFRELLVGVTEFFREPEAWRILSTSAIDPMLRGKAQGGAVRAWVAGCATGQEAYSLGMLLLERAEALNKTLDIKIFASDINDQALNIARFGVYPAEVASQIPAKRLERFFERLPGGGYQARRELRDRIVFAQQSLISDAPFSKLDLITCRNLLIYLEPMLQQQVLKLFHFAIAEGGFLFLGIAESITGFDGQYKPVSKKWRIFQREQVPAGAVAELPIVRSRRPHGIDAAARVPGGFTLTRLAALAQQLVLEGFAPASVLVNRNFEILYYCGPTHDYLVNPTGMPTHNLLDMARTGLRVQLRSAVNSALKDRQAVTLTNIRLRRGTHYVLVTIRVSPMHEMPEASDLLLVVFEEQAHEAKDEQRNIELAAGQDELLVQQLEYDLKVTREDLQANVEELETSNEELKAANEEMTSMNEELLSANEELETSKEEMQSLNEELTTVNNQLQSKVEELEATNDDLENLLSSTEFATIFLDREFRVRRFTPPTRRLISLTLGDIGRPLTDFAQRMNDAALMPDAVSVLESLEPVEREVRGDDGRHYLRRILPYRSKAGQVEGVVVTFTDISHRKTTEEHQKVLIAELDHRVKNTLAVVQSMASQTLKQSKSMDEFGEAFEGRILAMAKAHTLLSQEHWKGTSLRSLVEKLLGPYCGGKRHRCDIAGDDVVIEPKRAISLTMVLHELTTNAVKHGALSNSHGKLELSWAQQHQDSQPRLQFSWIEKDGPPVAVPEHAGFGTGLIKRCVEYELEGKAQIEFERTGLQFRFMIPWPDRQHSGSQPPPRRGDR